MEQTRFPRGWDASCVKNLFKREAFLPTNSSSRMNILPKETAAGFSHQMQQDRTAGDARPK